MSQLSQKHWPWVMDGVFPLQREHSQKKSSISKRVGAFLNNGGGQVKNRGPRR